MACARAFLSQNRALKWESRDPSLETEQEGVVQRDTSIAAEISQSRNTSVSSNIDFDIGRFKLRKTLRSEERRTNRLC